MISNSKELLITAKNKKVAIPQFNINNLEWTKYILEECNKNNSPVILGVTEKVINYMGGYKVAVNLIKSIDEELNISVPVVIHLDHGKSFESIVKAIDAGFTSVMIDASDKILKENIEITKQVVEYAHKKNVTVEAELGSLKKNQYTSMNESIYFINETNIDSFAPSIGNYHGVYKKKPRINHNLCKELNSNIDIPLVLHGASGIPDEDVKKIIEQGFVKININTELQMAWAKQVRKYLKTNKNEYDPRTIISSGEDSIKKIISSKLELINKSGG